MDIQKCLQTNQDIRNPYNLATGVMDTQIIYFLEAFLVHVQVYYIHVQVYYIDLYTCTSAAVDGAVEITSGTILLS